MWAGDLPLIQHQTCYRPLTYPGFPHTFVMLSLGTLAHIFSLWDVPTELLFRSNSFVKLRFVAQVCNLSFIPLNAKWFESYSRALLEDNPHVARLYLKNAFDVINEKLKESDLENEEREAILSAVHFLQLVEKEKFQRVA